MCSAVNSMWNGIIIYFFCVDWYTTCIYGSCNLKILFYDTDDYSDGDAGAPRL